MNNWQIKLRKVAARRSKFPLPRYVHTLAEIEPDLLQSHRIKGIILDLDNTVVSEDDRYLAPHAETWIATAQSLGFSFFILSNGKRQHRVDYWSDRLKMPTLSPARKPFPRSFRRALRSMGLPSSQVVVIGDSLHTDLIGAWIVGCRSIQVASLPHPPRWWEKIAGWLIQKPYTRPQELWNFSEQEYSRKQV
ncbi:YqeG family HAD IIIA-type phosphatase [Phormidesmis sp. 146-33]